MLFGSKVHSRSLQAIVDAYNTAKAKEEKDAREKEEKARREAAKKKVRLIVSAHHFPTRTGHNGIVFVVATLSKT